MTDELLFAKTRNTLDNNWPNVILSAREMNQPLRAKFYDAIVSFCSRAELFRVALAACFLACASISSIAAEDKTQPRLNDLGEMPLEALMEIEVPTVVGASKFEQRITEAPSSISLITSDEIKSYGHRTLADALQSLQGFHVSYDRNYAFLGTRGLNLGDFNGRVLLLVNGHRVNNNLTDGAFIDSAFILDVDLIDRVEVIRGPGSVLYGNNAFFGVINVVTRTGKQVNGTEFSGEYGEFETYKGRVTIGHAFTNGLDLLLSGSFYDSAGADRLFYKEFNTPAQNRGIARGLDDDGFGSFFGSLNYRHFTLEGGFISREKGNPTAQFGTTFNDPALRTVDERSYASLKYAQSFPDLFDVTAQVYYDRSKFNIDYPAPGLVFSEQDTGEWWGTEVQFTKRIYDRHTLTAGAEFRDDFRQEREFTLQDRVLQDRLSHGIYVQGDFEIVTNLNLNAGGRYDQYGDFDAAYNPRLALIYHPAPQSTLKFIYGTAFRAPNFLELALGAPGQDLEPEEITSYSIVYEQGIGQHLRSSVSPFYNEMDGLIAFQNGSSTNFDADTKGVELALEGVWTNVLRGRISYTYQQTDSGSFGIDLPDSPEHLAKLNLSVPLYQDKIFAGVEIQYTSARESLRNISPAGTPITIQGSSAGDFAVVNLTLYSRELVKNLEVSASVYNVFNQTYSDPATRFHNQDLLERDGRTFRVKLTYRF